jgi:hypothetical protein
MEGLYEREDHSPAPYAYARSEISEAEFMLRVRENLNAALVRHQRGVAPPVRSPSPTQVRRSAGRVSSTAERAMNVANRASRGFGHAQEVLRHQGLSGGTSIRLSHPECRRSASFPSHECSGSRCGFSGKQSSFD